MHESQIGEPIDGVDFHQLWNRRNDSEPDRDGEMKNFTGSARSDFPEGSVKLEYQLGKAKQIVKFGLVYVSRRDKTSYNLNSGRPLRMGDRIKRQYMFWFDVSLSVVITS